MSVRRRFVEELRRTLGPSGKRPHTTSLQPSVTDLVHPGYKHENAAKPYSEVPGPKELPFIGNAWRFLPFIDVTQSQVSRPVESEIHPILKKEIQIAAIYKHYSMAILSNISEGKF
ncbi:hypothetical protein C0J52_27966, partial [Blattella germanica]